MIRRFLLVPLGVGALLVSSCSTFAVAAATVNGQKIRETQVEEELDRVRADPTFQDLLQRQADELRGVARRNILTGLIRQAILEQEARAREIDVTQEQTNRLISQEAERQGQTVEQFRRANNLSPSDARIIGERIVRQFELRRRVTEEVDVSDSDVRRAYDAQKEAFEEVNLLRITVRTQADARRVVQELDRGETFATLAPRLSIDDLAEDGGDMGYVPLASLSPEAQTAIQNSVDGGVTEPVAGAGGIEIYRVVNRRSRPFGAVEDDLRGQLADQAREQGFEQWLNERLQKASVVVNPKYGRFDRQAMQVVPGDQRLRP
jgi:parvulin-like peptidyl-prolyl isomerase